MKSVELSMGISRLMYDFCYNEIMSRIPSQLRIYLALFIAFGIVRFAPAILVSSPYIPTKDELLHLVVLPSFSLFTSSFISRHQETPVAPTDIPVIPTEEPLVPTEGVQPTDIPPTLYILPTWMPPTIIPTVEPTIYISPTVRPTIRPTNVPTIKPTNIPTTKPMPTSPPSNTPNYVKLNAFVANPPQIGCYNNTISGCPVDTLYQTPLEKGLGWATYYGDEHNTGYNVVADVIHNNKGITVDAARAFIDANYMEKQSQMTPAEAKKTGKVIAFGATRTPKDLWKIKYAFGIDDAKNPQARFIGRIMIIDCAATNDWKSNLATLTYSYVGWTRLNWIVDLSKNGFIQLPTGYSGRQDNIGEGRPGVILVDEAALDGLIY